MVKDRPSVPNPVKRTLRQESGFGCCVCGLPILQYHHIIEWAQEKHFRPEDMMAVCPTHHDMMRATPEAVQRRYKLNPRNRKLGRVTGPLLVRQSFPAIQLGSTIMVNEGTFLKSYDEELLGARIEDGELKLSLRLRSSTNELLCGIVDNEWTSGDFNAWDIEADWQKLVIREKAGQINLSLDLRKFPAKLRGSLWSGGGKFTINDAGLFFAAQPNVKSNEISNIGLAGIAIEISSDRYTINPGAWGFLVGGGGKTRELLWNTKNAWIKAQKRRVEITDGFLR